MLTQSIAIESLSVSTSEHLENYFDQLHQCFINILHQKKTDPILKICLMILLDKMRLLWNQIGVQAARSESHFNLQWMECADIQNQILNFPPQHLKHCAEDSDIISAEWHTYSDSIFKNQLKNSMSFSKNISWCESIYQFYFDLAKIKRYLIVLYDETAYLNESKQVCDVASNQSNTHLLTLGAFRKKISSAFQSLLSQSTQVIQFPIPISPLLLFLYPQHQSWNQLKSTLSPKKLNQVESRIIKNILQA